MSCQQLFTTLQSARCIYNLAILTKLFVVVLSKRAREVFGNTVAGLLSPPGYHSTLSPTTGRLSVLWLPPLSLKFPMG